MNLSCSNKFNLWYSLYVKHLVYLILIKNMQEEKNRKTNKYVWIFIALVLVWIIIKIFNNKIQVAEKNNLIKENIATSTIATSTTATTTIFTVNIKANGNEPG